MNSFWMNMYYDRQFDEVNPILDLAVTTPEPAVFDATMEFPREGRNSERADEINEMLDGFRGQGGNSSLVVPMFSPPSDRQVFMGLASQLQAEELQRMLADNTHEILIGSALIQSVLAAQSLNDMGSADFRFNPGQISLLTTREREVLNWLAAGLRTGRIAEKMNIANVTVNYHIVSIKRKLKAKTRERALAITQKIIEL